MTWTILRRPIRRERRPAVPLVVADVALDVGNRMARRRRLAGAATRPGGAAAGAIDATARAASSPATTSRAACRSTPTALAALRAVSGVVSWSTRCGHR